MGKGPHYTAVIPNNPIKKATPGIFFKIAPLSSKSSKSSSIEVVPNVSSDLELYVFSGGAYTAGGAGAGAGAGGGAYTAGGAGAGGGSYTAGGAGAGVGQSHFGGSGGAACGGGGAWVGSTGLFFEHVEVAGGM
ncbi:hypothetical protein HMI55_005071 [Coelomomyces lativittatus]|nr:hypothetical protein HMI55_005071 [Coelomomyces lativittatus]